jgi:hypothetical protein
LPYLVSVPDPWDADSPNHVWEPRVLDGRALARTLGLAAPVIDVVSDVTPSGRPRAVAVTTKAGGRATLTGTELRRRLGLLSPFFRIAVLELGFGQARLGAAARPGIVLEGAVRAVDRALIEKRADDGSWVPAVKPRVRSDGAFTVVVRPRTTTRYRITGDGLVGPELVVRPHAVAG